MGGRFGEIVCPRSNNANRSEERAEQEVKIDKTGKTLNDRINTSCAAHGRTGRIKVPGWGDADCDFLREWDENTAKLSATD